MTRRIRIRGRVQGVGFRPFIWRSAVARGLKGQVVNGVDGVVVDVEGATDRLDEFQQFITQHPPRGSYITSVVTESIDGEGFNEFSIRESEAEGVPTLLLTPDTALCETCRAELFQPDNRRFHYAFTTCTYCGPRYSIMWQLPYDRQNTTMSAFVMCPDCRQEYETVTDTRFYAQTNSCPACGVVFSWYDFKNPPVTLDTETAIDRTIAQWNKGEIVAVKGIGGYLLTCDATRTEAVMRLRARKRRPSKPFAVMYPDWASLERDIPASERIRQALIDPAAPIVLTEVVEQPPSGLVFQAVAPGLDRLGVMLPYAPLFELLLSRFQKPIVATSGNISHEPIAYDESQLEELSDAVDFALIHNRPIALPQDDSVLHPLASDHTIILRRSRGLAPFMPWAEATGNTCTVALGAEMKSSFTLNYGDNLFVSQYWGDLSDWGTQTRYEQMLQEIIALLKVNPQMVVGDLHPAYFSTRLGEALSAAWQTPFRKIQHHEAHFAAVLAENDLLHAKEPVLGVIWDGTGLGEDGQIWGGEFFLYENGAIRHVARMPYFPFLLGDKMPREPRISAMAFFGQWPEMDAWLAPKFDARAWGLYQKMRDAHQGLSTSSVGRLFDAAASILGLADTCSYEGEAALYLEVAARRHVQKEGVKPGDDYLSRGGFDPFTFDWAPLFLEEIRQGKPVDYLAAQFHHTLVEIIASAAAYFHAPRIAFSGGVFQNALLHQLIVRRLDASYSLHFHKNLSPNDENVSFGQWIHARYFSSTVIVKK